jgi:maleylpyruvate isomerase
MSAPSENIARVSDAQRRFLDAATDKIDDAAMARPTRLPGWTIGHLLTHLARNADSHRRRAEAAAIGQVVEQYPGGYAGREAEIQAGAARSARVAIGDVRHSADRLMSTWLALPAAAWDNTTRDVAGRERPLRILILRRWQELEVHLVDLDIGVTHLDWSLDFVSVWLPGVRADVGDRLPVGAEYPPISAFADQQEELAWLYRRTERPDLPELDPWQ